MASSIAAKATLRAPHGHDPDPDGEVLGGGQDGGGLGDTAAPAEVLHHPDLVEPQLLGAPDIRQHLADGEIERQHHTDSAAGGGAGDSDIWGSFGRLRALLPALVTGEESLCGTVVRDRAAQAVSGRLPPSRGGGRGRVRCAGHAALTAVVAHGRVNRTKAWLRATTWVSQPITAGPHEHADVAESGDAGDVGPGGGGVGVVEPC